MKVDIGFIFCMYLRDNYMQRQGRIQRRKRKDSQSRDFTCGCGKGYLSYAAAYTHVKNKHNLHKAFIDNIKKPQREKLRRGRPKEQKQRHYSVQTILLTLIETSILKIFTELTPTFDKIMLEGNQQRNENEFNQQYQLLCKANEEQLRQFDMNSNDINGLVNILNKDFNCQVACRIKLALIVIQNMEQDEQHQILNKLNDINLWKDRVRVDQIVLGTYRQWRQIHEYDNPTKMQISNSYQ